MKTKFTCMTILLSALILYGNCDTNTKDDSKDSQTLLLLLGSCSYDCVDGNPCGQATIDGSVKHAYENGGIPVVSGSYDVGNDFTSIEICFTNGCSEQITIFMPGQPQKGDIFEANSTGSHRSIVYTNAGTWTSDSAFGGSGRIEVTNYDSGSNFIQGRFSGTVSNQPPNTPGWSTHTIACGCFATFL